MMQKETKLLALFIGILVVIGIGMSGLHYLRDPYNPGFNKYPVITSLHIIPGTIYLLFAPFQFLALIRSKWINLHRWVGWIISVLAIMVGITSSFMAVVFPFSGLTESIAVGFFAIIFLVAILKGLIKIRAKDVASHRDWMIRAFALGLAIATSRIIFLPLFFSLVDPTLEQIKILFITCFVLAFSSHMIFAELWIKRTKANNKSFD